MFLSSVSTWWGHFRPPKFLTHLVDPSHVVKHMETLSQAQGDIFVAVFHDRINPTSAFFKLHLSEGTYNMLGLPKHLGFEFGRTIIIIIIIIMSPPKKKKQKKKQKKAPSISHLNTISSAMFTIGGWQVQQIRAVLSQQRVAGEICPESTWRRSARLVPPRNTVSTADGWSKSILLGGWTNPFDKIWVKMGIFPQIGMNIKHIWNHHLEFEKVSWGTTIELEQFF